MPHSDDEDNQLLRAGKKVQSSASRFWDGFSDFVFNDNVLEVACGLIIASAFTAVVKSFVGDVVTPILSLLPFIDRNFGEKFAVLKRGPQFSTHNGYNTVKQAQNDGAVVLTYGYIDPIPWQCSFLLSDYQRNKHAYHFVKELSQRSY